MKFSPSGDVGGLDLVGFAVNSRTATETSGSILTASKHPRATSDDTDGDGLPNTWEIANGLDQ